jgi:hypothetical protein
MYCRPRPPNAPTQRAFSACAADWRVVLFNVKTRLCNGEPSPSEVRRIRVLESQFGKNLAKMSIIGRLHLSLPSFVIPR